MEVLQLEAHFVFNACVIISSVSVELVSNANMRCLFGTGDF